MLHTCSKCTSRFFPQTHIQANLYGMGHDPEIFPEPELYQPERWLRTKAQMTPSEQAIYVFANLPWGHGPRMCLGRSSQYPGVMVPEWVLIGITMSWGHGTWMSQ